MRPEKSSPRTSLAESGPSHLQSVPSAPAPANGSDPAGVISQVRELLFGESKRESEASLSALDAKVDALAASMRERFSEVESRVADLARESEHARASAVDDIGAAIAQLGASIRNMSGARKAN